MAENPFLSLRPLWEAKKRLPNTATQQSRALDKQIISITLEFTAKLIDGLYQNPPPVREISSIAWYMNTELSDLGMCQPDQDDEAEIAYLTGRMVELDAWQGQRVTEIMGDKAAGAASKYKQAITSSSRGSGRKLAVYQAALAACNQRWNLKP